MNDTNPEIEKQLERLAEICQQSLKGGQPIVGDETEALLKSLLMSGYSRKANASLQSDIETRVKDTWREPAMHRGGELSALTNEMQKKFNELKRWESSQPEERSNPKAANISSATDA